MSGPDESAASLPPRRKAGRRASRSTSSPDSWAGLPEGALVVVDAAPLIYLLEDHATLLPRFIGLFEAEAAGTLRIAISTIAIAEVLSGPSSSGHDALVQRYLQALARFIVLPVDIGVAAAAARLRARYRLKLPDALQLATALEAGADALVTHDRDFSRVEGLRIISGAAGS